MATIATSGRAARPRSLENRFADFLGSAAVQPLDREDHVQGAEDAPLELVMYGDFQCPYCAAAQSIVRRVRDRTDGRLRFAFRHLPLPEVHPDAQRAAEAAEAAAAQGRFWEMHDALYANRGALGESDLIAVARRLGLDTERFATELRNGTYANRVARDAQSAREAGVMATPAFFTNGVLLHGAFDAGSLVEALERT
jgi:protein-disulfide isomerase